MSFPVIDLHCDMTVYMIEKSDANPMNGEDIGSAIPHLRKGNVMAQVMAFFTPSSPIIHNFALKQAKIFNQLINDYPADFRKQSLNKDINLINGDRTLLLPAIENASGFCHEDQNLDEGLKNFEQIIELTGGLFYVGFMHWADSRFGGAAGSKTGLLNDGRVLLDYLHDRKIAVDLSHAGDKLALDIFDYISGKGLKVPVIASHSNFRSVKDHPRNLTDELAKEIINRGSIIGINFMRNYLGNDDPDVIFNHIEHGLKLGAENVLCIGADFFWDEERTQEQIYYKKFQSASTYPLFLEKIKSRFSEEIAEKIAFKNAANFIRQL